MNDDFSRPKITFMDFFNIINFLFNKLDQYINTEFILTRLTEEASELLLPVITLDKEQIEEHLPDIPAWIVGLIINLYHNYPGFQCSFISNKSVLCDANSPSELLANIIIQKYIKNNPPAPEPCVIDIEKIKEKFSKLSINDSLKSWQESFKIIYGNINKYMPADLLLNNLIKDIGSLVKLIREKNDADIIAMKLSSVFAWTFALANKFNIDLEQAIARKYLSMEMQIWTSLDWIKDNYDKLFTKFNKNFIMMIYNIKNISDILIDIYEVLQKEENKDFLLTIYDIGEIGDDKNSQSNKNNIKFNIIKIKRDLKDLYQIFPRIYLSSKFILILDKFENFEKALISVIMSINREILSYNTRDGKIEIVLRPKIYLFINSNDKEVLSKIYKWFFGEYRIKECGNYCIKELNEYDPNILKIFLFINKKDLEDRLIKILSNKNNN